MAVFVPAAPVSTWPDWLRELQATRPTDHARIWLEILGCTGDPFRSHISAEFSRQRRLKAGSGGERQAIQALQTLDLITLDESRLGNRNYHLVALTTRGIEAFQLLYGREPATQHYARLLALHKSPDLALLILLTQEVLSRLPKVP